ncbi:CU044_2847 family protein [Dendronalium sp. ChiSLP03b]|uniref:CU044_2847 family protein n=1 Tax=Dendronalium sp. ChiSLP03b TaxID=3075381 RepID=UPI00391B15E7
MGIFKPSKLVEFSLEDGTTAFVEIEGDEEDISTRGLRKSPFVERSGQSFRSAISAIKPIAGSIIREIRSLEDTPDKVSVEFGVRMNAVAGLVISPADSVSHFRITLTWEKESNGRRI